LTIVTYTSNLIPKQNLSFLVETLVLILSQASVLYCSSRA